MPRKLFKLIAFTFLSLFCFTEQGQAQSAKTIERESEWQNYKLPSTDFIRHYAPKIDTQLPPLDKLPAQMIAQIGAVSKKMIFRVPADWQQLGDELKFKGPEGIELQVYLDEIPDGVNLKSYVMALLQGLRGLPEGPDSIITRRVQMSGIEARELLFHIYDVRGEVSRRVIWTAVDGPRAVTFLFMAPLSRIKEFEPYFKGVVQSTIILENQFHDARFEVLCSETLIEDKPTRIDEVLSFADKLDGLDQQARSKAIEGLASIFASSPDVAIDLLRDRRTMVRAGAVEAIGLSGNKALFRFLFDAANSDLFVADRAARALARLPNTAQLLSEEWKDSPVVTFQETLRAAAYLDRKQRAQIAANLFKAGAKKADPATILPPKEVSKKRPSPPPPPPPPPPPADKSKGPPSPPPPAALPETLMAMQTLDSLYLNEQFIAINLLRDIPADEFRMPIAEIVAKKNDRVTVAALQVALERRETLPVNLLLSLLDSSDDKIQKLAVLNIGESAAPSDIRRLEAQAQKLSVKRQPDATRIDLGEERNARVAEGLRLSIEKIRLREQLSFATGDDRRGLLEEAMKDLRLKDWVWTFYLRDEIEGARQKTAIGLDAQANDHPRTNPVQPLGENLFPEDVKFYAAIPSLSASLNRLGDALNNIQMDSAQGQASFVFLLNSLKQQAARFFEAPLDGPTLDYIGIDPEKPIAMAAWTAEGAPRSLASAERKAVIAHVRDRYRFERSMGLYQTSFGSFASLPDNVSIGGRIFSFLPALLPVGGALALRALPTKNSESSLISFYLTGRDQCNGYRVKIIERRGVTFDGTITSDAIYLAYAGDTAVLAADWYSLRDALTRLDSGKSGIGRNPEFKRAVEAGGDCIYMSNLSAVFATTEEKEGDDDDSEVMESGALRISNAALENSFNISFKESEWTKALSPFRPDQAAAPRELLPRSTVMYLLLDMDVTAVWRKWGTDIFGKEDAERMTSIWAMDFEKEIAPELGKESGLALMELPDLGISAPDRPSSGLSILAFFKLKTDKLAQAFRDGKLFKNVSERSKPAQLKLGSSEYKVTIKNGYLIFSQGEEVAEKLDQKEKLAEARDFQRAAKNAPTEVIAFGGYNLEAAIASIKKQNDSPDMEEFIKIFGGIAGAFHSQIFYALPDTNGINARTSVSVDREGRYSVAELSSLSKDFRMTYAIIEARGLPIADQRRLDSLKLRIRSKGTGTIDRIKADVDSAHQAAEKRSEEEIILNVRPRHLSKVEQIELPISGSEFAPFLQSTRDIRSNDTAIIEKAREIAGGDRDAWSVARKLADWTYKNLKWKRVSGADAAETLATREADCSEFSQLFVSLARALGLPAREVSGLAYDGNSFGGHAWVEVYVGEWIEMDPTWGTDFADATHIRGESGDLLHYAALNLIDIEVLEALRGVPDFQRDATALVTKLCEELPANQQSALTAAIDLAVLTDRQLGEGAWAKMTDDERAQMFVAYHRMIFEITSGFEKDEMVDEAVRLLKVNVEGDRAEALALCPSAFTNTLIKIQLTRVGEAWMISDIIQTDTGFHIITEVLQPSIRNILEQRSGKQTQKQHLTAFSKILLAMNDDAAVALELAEQALKDDPKNRDLRYLKSLVLFHAKKPDEAENLLKELCSEEPPFAPALFKLAEICSIKAEEAEWKKAPELYERYLKIEPDDPRARSSLAWAYRRAGDRARAEAQYREAIRCDPRSSDRYSTLANFLVHEKRYREALDAIDEGAKYGRSKDELFNALLLGFFIAEEKEPAEGLIAAYPERFEKNADANYYLGYIRIQDGRAREALPLLKKSIQIDPDDAEKHNALAEAYRALKEWRNALAAADAAIKIDDENAEAHYHKACALAQLGRKTAAIAALKRAIELGEAWKFGLAEEEDLKPLASLAEFKKLLPKEDKDK